MSLKFRLKKSEASSCKAETLQMLASSTNAGRGKNAYAVGRNSAEAGLLPLEHHHHLYEQAASLDAQVFVHVLGAKFGLGIVDHAFQQNTGQYQKILSRNEGKLHNISNFKYWLVYSARDHSILICHMTLFMA